MGNQLYSYEMKYDKITRTLHPLESEKFFLESLRESLAWVVQGDDCRSAQAKSTVRVYRSQ